MKKSAASDIKAILFIAAASVGMAVNIQSFVNTAGLYPGGFSGIALLVQRAAQTFLSVHSPFSLGSYPLNILALAISYKYLGKRFILYTCLAVGLSGAVTDLIPAFLMTEDVLLCSIFGGICNGVCVSICMMSRGSTGGLDIVANVYGHKLNRDPWNIVLGVNCLILLTAGVLFGWDKALYSIIFQYASTQVIRLLYRKYQQMTLFIVSEKYEDVYRAIRDITAHSATILDGTGGYSNTKKKMIYSVVSSQEAKQVVKAIRQLDDKAFINQIQTKELDGRFIYRD